MWESIDKQRHELNEQSEKTKKKIREMDVMMTETELEKNDLVKIIRMSQRKREELNGKNQQAKQEIKVKQKTKEQRSEQELWVDMEASFDEQLQQVDGTREILQHKEYQLVKDNKETNADNEVNSVMQSVILEIEGIRRMLRRVREDSLQSKREIAEEKNQKKLVNVCATKQRQMLDQKLKKTMKEKSELETLKINIQQTREVEQKLQDSVTAILTMGSIKTNIEKAAVDINTTRKEILQAQRMMKENRDNVSKLMVSKYF